MKAKKPAAKSVKKAIKPAAKKTVPAKAVSKKAVVKAKMVIAKPAVATPKAKASAVNTAAAKLKKLFIKAKPAAKTIKKSTSAADKKTVETGKTVNEPKAPAPVPKPFKSSLVAPKGLLTEAQIRRMSDKDYMNDMQLEFFRHRLLQMREEVLAREVDVKERLHQREIFADPADRATAEEEHWLDLRLRERESLLLRKIDEALRRIAEKEFGYCEKTGDPIGIPRLLARPTATVCVDVKGQDERVEAQFRDR